MKYDLAYDALVDLILEYGIDKTGFGTKSLYLEQYDSIIENPQYKSLLGHIFRILFPNANVIFTNLSTPNSKYIKLSIGSPDFFGDPMRLSEIRLSSVFVSPDLMTSTRTIMIRF